MRICHILTGVLCLIMVGCGSLLSYMDIVRDIESYRYVPYFSGVVADFSCLFTPIFPFAIVDMPLSLCWDTLAFPFILTINLIWF